MLNSMYSFFAIIPDVEFDVMQFNQSLATLTNAILTKMTDLLARDNPDLIIVQGDTTTAMASALSAFYLKIPVGHVEAGLRSFDNFAPFPEEVNRKIISSLAKFHFAPTKRSYSVLKAEKVMGHIQFTGNTVIDSLVYSRQLVTKYKRNGRFKDLQKIVEPFDGVVLITGHRRENFGPGLESICESINILAKRFPTHAFIYPVHLNPNVREVVNNRLSSIQNVFLLDPVGYPEMIFLLDSCKIILTDSGGIQEEAPSFRKPVLIMRSITERMEGVEAGCSLLVGTSKRKIVKFVTMLLTDSEVYKRMSISVNPYGDGKSADRIKKILLRYLCEKP